MKSVNAPIMKKDAMALVTGKPVYTDDIAPKDCLVCKILRSQHAHAVIEEINRDHVMLRYQGKIERLSLAEEERSTVAVTNKKAVSDEAKQAVAEPAVSAPVEIPAAVRQALAKDPQKIFNYIQLTPVRKEGIVGYAVKPGADRSLFDASGFKEGDIAIALNQQDFTDPRAMIALMRQLPSMDSIQLTVLRKGARHDISIALR